MAFGLTSAGLDWTWDDAFKYNTSQSEEPPILIPSVNTKLLR